MFVCVAGLDHRLQQSEPSGFLRANIHALVENYQIGLIGEEAQHEWPTTVAKQIAESCKVLWVNVDMSKGQRESAGLKNHRFLFLPTDCGTCFEKYLLDDDEVRENHMVEEIMRQAGTIENILVICGPFHVAPLARKFKAINAEVVAVLLYEVPVSLRTAQSYRLPLQ